MRNPFFAPPIIRLSVRPDPDDEPGIPAIPRKKGSRRPHADAKVAQVRRLVENTVLTYTEIAAKTGVAQASICRWSAAGAWKRPLFAPRATDMVPRARASLKLKARTLTARIAALAERCVAEMEASARVDPDKLSDAIELMKMAKLAARPKRRRSSSPPPCGEGSGVGLGVSSSAQDAPAIYEAGPRAVMRALRAGGVDTVYAPEEALEDFIASRAPKPPRESRKAEKRRRHEEWMREKG